MVEAEQAGIEPEAYALVLPAQRLQTGFADLWSGAYDSADQNMRVVWERLRDAWLRTKESKSGSAHTRRSYETATLEWFMFLTTLRNADGRTVRPWDVTTNHVRLWQQQLLNTRGLAPSTVNQRLAACSSFYSFVIRERGLVDGREVTAFMDSVGHTRMNPFAGGNVQRAQTSKYGHARVLNAGETYKLLLYLESKLHTVTGLRNHALILTYLLTGYRNQEVISMKWGNIRPNKNQPGAWVFEWKGKGGKQENDPLPLRVYHALVAHLQRSGRSPERMGPDEFIFIPMAMHNLGHLKGQGDKQTRGQGDKGHLSNQSAQRILHSALAAAGVEHPNGVRIHDLRHTFAHRFRRRNPDLEALRSRLHHESLATTGIYVRDVLEDPVDDYSEGLYQGLLGV